MTNKERLEDAARSILYNVGYLETGRNGERHWWGHDTDEGTDAEVMTECLRIFKEKLGVSVCDKCGGLNFDLGVMDIELCGCHLATAISCEAVDVFGMYK